jgi:hypothetical protein
MLLELKLDTEFDLEPELKLDTELDLKPEYCHYRDEGCELGESCLNCRLPICVHDEPRGRQRWLKQQRDKEIVRLYKKGKSVSRLAIQFSVSRRTIQRALKKSIGNPIPCPEETEESNE